MKIARVTGTVTGTAKDSSFSGQKMLLVDILDAEGKVQEASVVVLDVCSAGPGDRVVVTTGSAARLPSQTRYRSHSAGAFLFGRSIHKTQNNLR